MPTAAPRPGPRPRSPAASREGPPVTASTFVAGAIRAEILKGALRLGSRLDQQALAERFGVSIIPVREGLRRLEAEGLVRMLPRRGAFVAELSLQELTEISWIRERLEDLAVRLAANRLKEHQLRDLEELNARMETMSADAFPSVWGGLNREWHFRIYSAGEAELLVKLITVLWDRTSVYREVLAADPNTRATSVAKHAEVLRRLQVGDASAAARAMRQHIRRGTTNMRAAEIAWGRAGTTMLHRARAPRSRSKDGPPITASNYVAIEIRAEILKGSLQAGSRLDQQVLAKRFGVSIIPVREGLKRLEAEGLVRMSPRRGAFVAQLTLQELTEISWIRERLEDLATRLAAPHLSDPHLRELEDLNVKMARMAGNVRPSVWSELNREWHFKIYAAGDSELLVQMIAVLWDRTSLYREVLATSQGIARSAEVQHGSVAQHAEMLGRLRVGDASGTARLMRQHIRRAIRDMRATEAGVSTGKRAMRSDGR